jgi:hypothetical protein
MNNSSHHLKSGLYSVGMVIKMRPSSRQAGRYIDTPKDREDVADFLRSFAPLIDMIMVGILVNHTSSPII